MASAMKKANAMTVARRPAGAASVKSFRIQPKTRLLATILPRQTAPAMVFHHESIAREKTDKELLA
jgi:hypothetical protein